MPGKIKGPGGIGQFDLGTATQDVRAATPRSPSRNTGNSGGGGLVMGGAPGMYAKLKSEGKIPNRSKGRSKGRGKARGKRR